MKLSTLSATGVLMASLLQPVMASAADVSVVGLYSQPLSSSLTVAGCHVLRQGAILAEDGDIDLDQPAHFLLAHCSEPVLSNSKNRDLFEELAGPDGSLALFEGLPVDLPPLTEDAAARQYILKVSYYNNENLSDRYDDLNTIRAQVRSSQDMYHNEAEVLITRAQGIPTPDAIDVIYYDTFEAGDNFRNGNPDILSLIGDFNDDHVETFIYYVGTLNM